MSGRVGSRGWDRSDYSNGGVLKIAVGCGMALVGLGWLAASEAMMYVSLPLPFGRVVANILLAALLALGV